MRFFAVTYVVIFVSPARAARGVCAQCGGAVIVAAMVVRGFII